MRTDSTPHFLLRALGPASKTARDNFAYLLLGMLLSLSACSDTPPNPSSPELARPQGPAVISRSPAEKPITGFLGTGPAGNAAANAIWQVEAGASLRATLADWTSRAGWRLAVDRSFDGDFVVAGGYRFEGTFEAAAYQLMSEVSRNADQPPKLVLHPANLHAVLFRQNKEAN